MRETVRETMTTTRLTVNRLLVSFGIAVMTAIWFASHHCGGHFDRKRLPAVILEM